MAVTSPPERPFVQGVVRGTAAAGIATVWTIVLSFLSVPIFLSSLGVVGFGAWVLVQTFSVFRGWGALLDGGVGTAAVKFVAERMSNGERREAAEASAAAIVVSLIGGTLGAGALIVAVRFGLASLFGLEGDVAADFDIAMSLFAVALPIDLVNRSLHFTLDGLQRVDLSRVLEVVRRTGVVVATAAVAWITGDLASVGVAYLVVSVPMMVLSMAVVRRTLPLVRPGRDVAEELIRYGLKVASLRTLGTVHRVMDRVVVGVILGPTAVALVEIVAMLQAGAHAVVAACAQAVTPSAAWLHARNAVDEQRQLVLRGTQFTMIATLPLVIGPAIAAAAMLRIWVGDDGVDAIVIVPIALALPAIVSAAQVASEFLLGVGRPRVIFRAAGTALIVNLCLTLVLVPWVGVIGAFIGSLVATPLSSGPVLLAALRATGTTVAEFFDQVVRPLVVPALWMAASAALMVLGPFADGVTIALIAVVGGGGYAYLVFQRVDLRALAGRT